MNFILDVFYFIVQALRLVLSALIVVYVFFFFQSLPETINGSYSSDHEFWLYTLPLFVFWVLAFIALNRIVPVIKNFKNENYFELENIKATKFLGVILLIYGISKPILEFVFKILDKGRFELGLAFEIESGLDVIVSHTALGMILFLISEVLKRGNSLNEEQKLTI
ncbi:DUF2975 domain-containing protein [Psychroflexus aestuariivivens]|uniref:DUF2975 domain-containing protein n=1 Tax=Psychroflexus aestuariivivens TaxID=1795040 RepID=UPI000FDC6557|nr:DUF2975 domain-containing protein [Psychroflexus aestuariivivens]